MASEREIENAKVMAAHAVRMERMSGLASTLPTWSLVGVVADHMSPLVGADDARVMERAGTVSVGCVTYIELTSALRVLGQGMADQCPMPPGDGECVCVVSLGGETIFAVRPCVGSEVG